MKDLSGNKCQCSVCKEYFLNLKSFDLHRKGVYGVNRYCVPPGQLEMEDKDGYWKATRQSYKKCTDSFKGLQTEISERFTPTL